MTLVRMNRPVAKTFNNFVDDFFSGVPSLLSTDLLNPSLKPQVPVNIRETETDYVLEVVAPGFEKEQFKIDLENNHLVVSAERKEESDNSSDRKVRKEYAFQSFSRSFSIDETINTNGISAKYLNGVLTLNLPKKVEVKDPAKQITVE